MTARADDLIRPLLAWYAEERRDLPWREGSSDGAGGVRPRPTAYQVLLSEAMCQQTRIATVLPYFARFLERWPTVDALAGASDDEVLAEWAGLGYYARARNLLRAAREATRLGGLPSTAAALVELPGIGPYTAGAIASIAFGEATPVVDGNVERVLSRVDGLTADPRSTAGRSALWARAGELQHQLGGAAWPGDLNQALMELGATLCTPKSPQCGRCPWAPSCVARADGDPARLPLKTKAAPPREMFAAYALIRGSGDDWLLAKRPPGLLGGLWEPPCVELGSRDDDAEAALRAALPRRVGVRPVTTRRVGEVVHVFTHRRLIAAVFEVTAAGDAATGDHYVDVAFVPPARVALSKLATKILAVSLEAPSLAAEAQLGLRYSGLSSN